MISLKNRLSLSYALFISAALLVLTLVVNAFTSLMFSRLVRNNISERSGEIVRTISEQYNPWRNGFDETTLEAMGMHFVHEGYIIRVEDPGGLVVWDARSCDMKQCSLIIQTIGDRMEQYRPDGQLQSRRYPVVYQGKTVGNVMIETWGPFFYSESELQFLSGLDRLLLTAGGFFTLLSVGISLLIASRIARPILKAADAARHIAGGNRSIRIPDTYKTKELRELSRSVNDVASALEEGERRQKQLTSDMAHELRTPLTCLRGNLEAMIDGVWQPEKKHLESCHEEVIRLIRLVEDLRALNGLEKENAPGTSGASPPMRELPDKTGFDLSRLLELVAGGFRGKAREKGVEIVLDLKAAPVTADYNRMKQVFINLISNALAYTDEGSVTVRGGTAGGQCEITVEDTGAGIGREELPHIFQRLYRTDKSRSRNTGGAGIGLAIADAIVKAHGGTISAESGGSGAGSVFRVTLPARQGG
ncbi:MAG: HAMP domain-containing histidine kinase [Treponema sp.]|jgi:signal transduction histidine kinase|nr:HAMP domain-containing histidine kinase [Treponema sp.]